MAPPRPEDEKVLSYNDVVLRRGDLDILRGPFFINDRLIEFYFSHLSATATTTAVLLVPPSISFWAANCPDFASLREVVLPLRLPEKDIAVFTVNDNPDVDLAEGGSHWSLLAYVRASNAFVHHDSSGRGMNRPSAERLYDAVKAFVGAARPPAFVEGSAPQQPNGYDCGVYVMAMARAIFDGIARRGLESGGGGWVNDLREAVDSEMVQSLRGEVLETILGLMETKNG